MASLVRWLEGGRRLTRIKDESSGMIFPVNPVTLRIFVCYMGLRNCPWNGKFHAIFLDPTPYPGWNRGKLRFLEIPGCMLHCCMWLMSSGLVIIGKSASWVGVFYEAKNFFHWSHCYKGGWNTQSIIDFAPKQPFKRSSNGSGSLVLFKDMAPYQPLDGCEITKHLLELPRAVVPSETPVRFGSLLLCNENHAPLHHGDGCSFWVACPGYVCIFCRKHVDELKPPVAIEKVLSTWPWNTRNCLAKWYFPL